ncbi:putative carbon monoxide dehydrogenase medium subunit transmembrane protein [Fulvimarina pelagi HTCC2506]|uniref:Putative carbon monoxide dehydrogenase medium subunit transmembrane protein n=1 Tax=Fulvimarina pelagi HTCC2506 TaxID=314231 RepID=Q0G399_9HYPH|nr:xanthine dehydrogenase family protein subunit M [Fulvimarina pelagi]EAU41932.1 putative carbon monoxide dehydrogenase medium subunit transmembrane protein [Fulvimarina pelagi HTCC2506]
MYETSYQRPTSIDEAVKLLGDSDGEGKLMSGGMTLIPTMKARLAMPTSLIDLRHVAELKGISFENGRLKIGGGTTHAEIKADATVKQHAPTLSYLAGLIGDPAVRHMGTIGGSVANHDPAADYPAALLAMGATIHTNTREVVADDFFTGMFETALEENEIVTAVSFEPPQAAGWEKFRNPASRYAMAGVFVAKRADGSVGVGVTGAGNAGVFRWKEAESALGSNFDGSALDGLSLSANDMMGDMHGSAGYRANLVKVVTKRAVASAKR